MEAKVLHLPESYQVRPRFEVLMDGSVEEVTETINSAVAAEEGKLHGRVKHRFGTLFLPPEEQHYWSPQLQLTLEQTKEGTVVRGLYGPRAAVWTLFTFLYTVLVLATLMVATIGYAYYTLGKPVGILWLLPVFCGIFLALYLSARTGKKWSRDELRRLHFFISRALEMELV